jgi:hypothetical protein
MEVIEELHRDVVNMLLAKLQEDHDFGQIQDVLGKPHIFRARVYATDFDDILINSSTEPRELQQSEYPSLSAVVRSIIADDSFLNRTHENRGLSGAIVQNYRDELLNDNSKPKCFFIVDRTDYPEMNQDGLYYVRDGMHHLVAYGLATQMNENAFPIVGYYCSSSKRM